ncbi:MAG TPA: Rieske 2Fe-2S domain-containing protein [Chloroflexota bacterium]|nr:Rieske 2Fe-2S domain-containing protein [Chloroflexota bacterium]
MIAFPMTDDDIDLVHTGADTLAGRYLRLFWQPVYRAQDLPAGRAKPIRIMNEELTLYRGQSGAAHMLAFRCAHRGTQLSTGWVEDDCIRCFYHGWKYDATGQCVEQPAEGAGFAAKIRIRAYPVREYLGLVFAYLGEGEPPTFRQFPQFDAPGVVTTTPPETWPCNYYNRLDNDADPYHVDFTHYESIGRTGRLGMYEERHASFEETNYGVRVAVTVPNRETDYFHAIMPNVNQIRVRTGMAGGSTVWEERMTWAVPITDESSLRFEVNHVALAGDEAAAYREQYERDRSKPLDARRLGDPVLAGELRVRDIEPDVTAYELFRVEDYATEVGQGRIADRSRERLGRSDLGVIMRRKLWLQDLKALAEGRPRASWQVPRPA